MSYTSMLEREPGGRARFDPLPEDAIATRRRDAKRELRVRVSKEQAAFLKEIEETAGAGVRRAVREAVRVRRPG